jgi:DNA adenine methylase
MRPTRCGALRAPFRWAGSKAWLAARLRPYAEQAERWVEPFAGSAAVPLALGLERVHLNDLNPHLMRAWRAIQRGDVRAIDALAGREAYETLRAEFNAAIERGDEASPEAVAKYLRLQAHAYRGLHQFDAARRFVTTYGGWRRRGDAIDLRPVTARIATWTLGTGDFAKTHLRVGDTVYADPPYVGSAGQYADAPFTWVDFERLLDWLDEHDGPVVVSQRAAPDVVDALAGRGYEVTEFVGPSDNARFGRGEVVGWRGVRVA